jgi:hypothetical protein
VTIDDRDEEALFFDLPPGDDPSTWVALARDPERGWFARKRLGAFLRRLPAEGMAVMAATDIPHSPDTTSYRVSVPEVVPRLSSADDLAAAIEFADESPEFRWWVERRAKAMGLAVEYPWGDPA